MEKISAWMDGELDQHDALQQLSRLKAEAELAQGWHAYHVIGDALRGEPVLSRSFESRMVTRLAGEPTVLAPRPGVSRRVTTYALSAAASLAAVALVGWMAFYKNPLAPQPELAAAPSTLPSIAAPVSPPQLASVPSDGKMNEYLIAHQAFSPSTEIQGLAPYIRGVSTTQSGTER